MKFKNLTAQDKVIIERVYETSSTRAEAQEILGDKFSVHVRTIRKWAERLGIGLMAGNIINPSKVMVYDVETSQIEVRLWWTGKQYVNYKSIKEGSETKIITVAWKWLGDDSVSHLTWDKNHCDKELMEKFLVEYNSADMVVGYNNKNFDDRLINTRALRHSLEVNTFVKSFDIIKESKRLFRIPSYSLAFLCKFVGVTQKLSHEGIILWDKIQFGSKDEQKEYMAKMIEYNVGDINSTEEVYVRLRKYMGHKVHFGVLEGGENFSCPDNGSTNVRLYKKTTTAAGTVQIIMEDIDTGVKYKISNRNYLKFLDGEINENKLI